MGRFWISPSKGSESGSVVLPPRRLPASRPGYHRAETGLRQKTPLILFGRAICFPQTLSLKRKKKKKLKFLFGWGRVLFLRSGRRGGDGSAFGLVFSALFWFSGEIEEKPAERCVGSVFIPAPRCLRLHRINKPIKEFPAQTHPSDAPASGARRGGPRGRAAVPSAARRLQLRGRGGARPRVEVGGKRGGENPRVLPGLGSGGSPPGCSFPAEK